MKRNIFVTILLLLAVNSIAFAEKVTVEEVVRGDTFRLANGKTIKVFGVYPLATHRDGWKTTTNFVKQLVEEKEVVVKYESDRVDEKGNALVYVYRFVCPPGCALEAVQGYHYIQLDDGWYIFVNATIIKSGYGIYNFDETDNDYIDLFRDLESEARKNKNGIWGFSKSVSSEEGVVIGEDTEPMADFSGEWDWLERPSSKTFYLVLEQEGDKLKGSYCATAFTGTRIDCGFHKGACPVVGTVRGKVAEVEFTSCFGKQKGKARIVHKGDKIEWKMSDMPAESWYFCPRRAVLDKALKIWHREQEQQNIH